MPHQKQSEILMNFIGLKHQPVAVTLLNGGIPIKGVSKRLEGPAIDRQPSLEVLRKNMSDRLNGCELNAPMLNMKPLLENEKGGASFPDPQSSLGITVSENIKFTIPNAGPMLASFEGSSLTPLLGPESNLPSDTSSLRRIVNVEEKRPIRITEGELSITEDMLNEFAKRQSAARDRNEQEWIK